MEGLRSSHPIPVGDAPNPKVSMHSFSFQDAGHMPGHMPLARKHQRSFPNFAKFR